MSGVNKRLNLRRSGLHSSGVERRKRKSPQKILHKALEEVPKVFFYDPILI